jgi:hypothetical protein
VRFKLQYCQNKNKNKKAPIPAKEITKPSHQLANSNREILNRMLADGLQLYILKNMSRSGNV